MKVIYKENILDKIDEVIDNNIGAIDSIVLNEEELQDYKELFEYYSKTEDLVNDIGVYNPIDIEKLIICEGDIKYSYTYRGIKIKCTKFPLH